MKKKEDHQQEIEEGLTQKVFKNRKVNRWPNRKVDR